MNESRANVPASSQTIREHFAAMAMQGALADPGSPSIEYVKQRLGIMPSEDYIVVRDYPRYVAMRACEHADALIAELAKEKP